MFTPILGAWLHAKNWEELNEKDKARKSMIWVYVGFVYLVFFLFLQGKFGHVPDLVFILAWYFSSGKKQFEYIKQRDISYQKRPWSKPLLTGLGGLVAYSAIVIVIASVKEPSIDRILEKESVGLVNQIMQDRPPSDASCIAVSIQKETSDGSYRATAYLDNGDKIEIAIELKGEQILVSIPNQ